MVEHLDGDAQRFEDQGHLGAHVLRAVDRGHGKVAALDGGAVAAVAAFELGATVPGGFVFFDFEPDAARLIAPAHAVEDEELGLRSEEGGVTQAGRLEVGLGAAGDGARVAVIGLAVAGLHHVALQEQRGFFEEGVDVGGVRGGHELHVRGLDALPASDGRAVEGVARGEFVLAERRNRHGDVLLLASGVGETEVDEFDFVVLHHLHHVCDGLGHQLLLCLEGWVEKVIRGSGMQFPCHAPLAGGLRAPPWHGLCGPTRTILVRPCTTFRNLMDAPIRGPSRHPAHEGRRAIRRKPPRRPPPPP